MCYFLRACKSWWFFLAVSLTADRRFLLLLLAAASNSKITTPSRINMLSKKFNRFLRPRIELMNDSSATRVEDKPRDPPPAATPVRLPQYPQGTSASIPYTAGEIYRLFCTFSAQGPTKKHVDALNLEVTADVPLAQLVPNGYLPPTSWLADPATSGGSNVFPAPLPPPSEKLRNGASKPGHPEFYVRVKELLVNNEDAFRFLQRKPPVGGGTSIRIAHFRKTFEGLSDMAEYWDTSLDNYVTVPPRPETAAMDIEEIRAEAKGAEEGQKIETPSKTPKVTYTGRRIGTGDKMPYGYRETTIATFVETIAWCFRCRVEQTRKDRLRFHQQVIRALPSESVYCTPGNQLQARQGVREGPLMGVQCRISTDFRKPHEVAGEGKNELRDLFYEVALGLLIAQKRDREGKEEIKHWEGKWWCTEPRWGGGKGGPVADDEEGGKDEMKEETKTDAKSGVKAEAKAEMKGEVEEKGKPVETQTKTEPSDPARKKQKLSGAREMWNSFTPPQSSWDKNVTYQRIGKVKGSDHDDVSSPAHPLLSALPTKTPLTPQTDLPHLLHPPPHLHHPPPHPHRLRRLHGSMHTATR